MISKHATTASDINAPDFRRRADPTPPDWRSLVLEDTWPDTLHPLSRLSNILTLLRHVFGKRQPVTLPDSLLGSGTIPKYILQEFHNLPNGNYSNHLTHGYITGFDKAMLGTIQRSREWIARGLSGCNAVLDIGTSGGKTAATIFDRGSRDVWGIDPSPYLLKHAAQHYPHIQFIPGIGENLPFRDERFDAISLCFVFHEVPPRYSQKILEECNRCLKPGGLMAIAEPSAIQFTRPEWRSLMSGKGWKHVYFHLMAHRAHEPFVKAWHQIDKSRFWTAAGFELREALDELPISHWLIQKQKDTL